MKLSKRIKRINPSITLELNARALQMVADGVELVSLAAGEPDIRTPQVVCEAAKETIDHKPLGYTATAGTPELRETICRYVKQLYGLDYKPRQVLVGNGAKHVIFNAVLALAEEGDQVLIPKPYWVSYPEMVSLAGAQPLYLETKDFKLQPQTLAAADVAPGTLLILNSPGNPSGAAYSAEEYAALAKVCVEKDLFVLADDIYGTILFDGRSFASIAQMPGMAERCLVVNGVSKTFAMTGWRIGFACGPQDLIGAMSRLQDHSTSCPSVVSQAAAVEALQRGRGLTDEWVGCLQQRRDLMLAGLREIPGVRCNAPEGAFYMMADVSHYISKTKVFNDSMALVEYLLEKARVVVVPGEAFGIPEHVRLSFAVDQQTIIKGLARMKEALTRRFREGAAQ
jgi:aspartate aminotransferase